MSSQLPSSGEARRTSDILVAVCVYNEGARLERVLEGFRSLDAKYDVLVVDDGSNDDTPQYIGRFPFPLLRHSRNTGVGASIRDAIRYGIAHDYTYIVIMAGNGKMQPSEIHRLMEPLERGDCDYVQGSRYLPGGHRENLPLFRHVMIKAFTVIAWALSGYRGTDVTCGFRAYRLSLFSDKRIDIGQDWLEKYDLEFYIHYKVIKLGYRIQEAPVSMIYPKDGKPHSKIVPFVGWWSMVRPWVMLSLHLKR